MRTFLHALRFNVEVYLLGRQVPAVRDVDDDGLSASAASVYHYHDVSVCGEAGFVFDNRGMLYNESAPITAKSKIRRPIRIGAPIMDGKVFHLAGECSWNRAHFMLEHGVRVMIANEAGALESCNKLLVHAQEAKWLDAYLKYFRGIPAIVEKVSTTKLTCVVKELVFVPGPSGDLLRFKKSVYTRYGAYLREGAKRVLGDVGTSDDVVWISRADAPERRCKNVMELQESFTAFSGRNLREVLLSELVLEEQIRLLTEAAVIVAEEGQALNLLPFVSDKIVIILDKGKKNEQSRWNRGFSDIASFVGNHVTCLFSELDATQLLWDYPVRKFAQEIQQIKGLRL